VLRRALLAGALAVLAAPIVFASPPPDRPIAPTDTVRNRDPIEIRPRFYPTALYSASRGFGIAGGVAVENLGWNGSRTTLDARLSQRYQSAALTLYSGNPYTRPLYAGVGAAVRTTTRRRFYGLGPRADRDDRLYLDYTSAEAEARVGWYPLGHTGLLLQPTARLLWDRLDAVTGGLDSARAVLDPVSAENLAGLRGDDRYGVSLGLALSSDTRDRLALATRGVLAQVEARRFFALDGSALRFNQVFGSVYGFAPLDRRGSFALVGRAVAGITRADDDARLPFFYLPTLDDALLSAYPGDRFLGRDLFAVGGGLRFPVWRGFGLLEVNGLVMAMLGSAYDDIGEEFSLRVSFDEDVDPAEATVPLRPALAVGGALVHLDRGRVAAGGIVGIGPEGIMTTSLTLVYDLREARALFR